MADIKGYGRLGSNPELKMIGEDLDKPVAEFRLFLSSLKKHDGETTDKGDWYSVSVWGKFAESVARLLRKGDPVYLEGTVRTETWEGDDGQEHRTMVIDSRAVFPHLPAIESLDFKPRKSDNAGSSNGDEGEIDDAMDAAAQG